MLWANLPRVIRFRPTFTNVSTLHTRGQVARLWARGITSQNNKDDTNYDVIVVGGGIEGSATAYTLAKDGLKTLMLDKFPLPHARGGSGGATRIIRKAYEDAVYTNMMVEAYPLWHKLEEETKVNLYRETGLLIVDKEPFPLIKESVTAFQKYDLPYTELSNEEMKACYPTFRVPDGYKGVLDVSGGTLKADECLECYQSMFKTFGGHIRDDEPVCDVVPGDTVTVRTNKGEYKAKHVALIAGSWTNRLLEPLGVKLPLQILNMAACYWRETDKQNTFPHTFILTKVVPWPDKEIPEDAGPIDCKIYGLPIDEDNDCMKICLHVGHETDPDKKDEETRTDDIESLREAVQKYFPTLESDKPAKVERCLYNNAPNHDPFIDRHPEYDNILVATGFSGHGFKLAPVVGKVLLEMVKGVPPSYDLSKFSINRVSQDKQ